MKRLLLAIVLVALTRSAAAGCWAMVDPGAFASDCPIIIRGRIVTVTEAAPGQRRADDLAEIQVAEILRNELKDVPLKVGGSLTVRMISRNNTQRTSTDLNYPVRTEATWLIVLNNKGEFRIDKHPVQKQPIDAKNLPRDSIRKAIKEGKKGGEPDDGRLTKEQWVVKVREQEARRAAELAKYYARQKEIRDIARGLADAEKLEGEAVRRFQKATVDVRRDVFQLRDHEQVMTGDRLVDVVEFVLNTDPDENVRVFAVHCLGYNENHKRAGTRAGAVLARALGDRSASVRTFACQTLWQRGEVAQAGAVVKLLGDRDAEVRSMAVTTLSKLSDAGKIDARLVVPAVMAGLVPELSRAVALAKKGTRDETYPLMLKLLEKHTGVKPGSDPLSWLEWWDRSHDEFGAPALKIDRSAVRADFELYEKLLAGLKK